MKTGFLILLMAFVVAALILAGCAQQAPAPSPAPAPKPAPASTPASSPVPVSTPTQAAAPKPSSPAVAAQPIKLKFSDSVPLQDVFNKDIYPAWIKDIATKTAAIGKPVEITLMGGGVLGKSDAQYNLVMTGVADIAMYGLEHYGSRFPLNELIEMPFMFQTSANAALVQWEMAHKYPEFLKEFSEAKLLWFQPTAPTHFQMRGKMIKTPADLKGLKVLGKSTPTNKSLELMGATPVTVMMGETYQSLERGMVDGGVIEWQAVVAFKWMEVTKYRSQLPKGLFVNRLAVSMNNSTWNSLPPEVQKIITETTGRAMTQFSGDGYDKANNACLKVIQDFDKKAGNPELYNIPDEELQNWKKVVTSVYDKWIADMTAKGYPAKAMFDDAVKFADQYAKAGK